MDYDSVLVFPCSYCFYVGSEALRALFSARAERSGVRERIVI